MPTEERPPITTYQQFAGMMDYALLAPTFSEDQVHQGCEVAIRHGIRMVTLRPADVSLASKWLQAADIRVGSVISYPHGDATTAAKVHDTRDLIGRGARNIETVLNLGKMISRQFQYVEVELLQMVQECHRAGATLTLDFEIAYLAADLRVIACKIARRTEVDVVRPSSLYGPAEYAIEDLRFLASRLGETARLDAGPSIRKYEDLMVAYEAGCDSFQTADPLPLLEAWTQELARRSAESAAAGNTSA